MLAIRLVAAAVSILPVLSGAEMIGDFAPMITGNKWTYSGSAGTRYFPLSSEAGVLVDQRDSLIRRVEVLSERKAADSSWFLIMETDSAISRTRSYLFTRTDTNGSVTASSVDSSERRDSVSTVLDTILVVGGEIVPGYPSSDCNCIPVGFLENMFHHRRYADSQVSDTSFQSEHRKYVTGGETRVGQAGVTLAWAKIKDIGLVDYKHMTWGPSGITPYDSYSLLKFESPALSSIPSVSRATSARIRQRSNRVPGIFLDYNERSFEISGRRVQARTK